ncbi:MAG: formylglycine-generating enzyme family protein [Treponema sp.]|nr:formylglycine-generating enzyme family protein [Treponema sp.]
MTKRWVTRALLLLVAAFTLQAQEKVSPPPGMVQVPGGTFLMGMPFDEEYHEENHGGNYYYRQEWPAHNVTVSSFFMDIYPVTQKQWSEVMGITVGQQLDVARSQWKEKDWGDPPMRGEGDSYPMYYVNWFEAAEYANRRSLREGLTPAYSISGSGDDRTVVTWNHSANGYRLPTEAEWEYAARGGDGSPGNFTYSGSNDINEVAWYRQNSGESTQPVGRLKPNALGLYDMSGNVHEWAWDWFGKYPSTAQIDPVGESLGSQRVTRGGSWYYWAQSSTIRSYRSPSHRNGDVGFRLVRPSLYSELTQEKGTEK